MAVPNSKAEAETMCGRFGETHSGAVLASLFDLVGEVIHEPQPEIYPTNQIAAITASPVGRELDYYRWWLVPSWWKKDLKEAPTAFNARAEGIAEKPLFRGAFKSRRCLIPASYFFEWQKTPEGKVKTRIERKDGQPLAFAGLWDTWWPSKDEPMKSCTIITTSANHAMEPIHTRMPVILSPDDWDEWLAPNTPPADLQHLLQPCPDEWLEIHPVETTQVRPLLDDLT